MHALSNNSTRRQDKWYILFTNTCRRSSKYFSEGNQEKQSEPDFGTLESPPKPQDSVEAIRKDVEMLDACDFSDTLALDDDDLLQLEDYI